MNCTDFQQQLDAAVDQRELVESEAVREHLANCLHCRAAWDEFLLLEAAIAAWRGQSLSVDLTERVMADWRSDRRESPKSSEDVAVTVVRVANQPSGMKWWPMLVPIVAALSLAVMVLINRDRGSELVAVKSEQPTVIAKAEEFADLSDLVEDAKSAWLGLARTTAARTQGLSVFIPSLKSSAGDETVPMPMDGNMLEDMNGGLKPVPDEFRKAFEFLLDAAQWDESQTT